MSTLFDLPHEASRASTVSRSTAVGLARSAGLSGAERNVVLALAFPADEKQFWRTLGGVGITRSGLMDSLGASP